jgi:plastocyanin
LTSVGAVGVLLGATVAYAAPGSSSAAPAARAPQTFSVMVGHDIAAGGPHRPADYMNFVPSTISVHTGDRITFAGEFHTATALPTSITNATAWVRTHARRLGQRYFFLARDDEPGRIIFNPNVIYPSCNPMACAVDGSRVVNSGGLGVVAPPKETFTINVPAGKSFWVVCLIHPQMRMLVHVVSSGTKVQTQAQIDAAAKRLIAAQTSRATALWQRLQRQHSHVAPSGRRVVDAYSGFDVKGLELFGMFPHTIHVRRGQTVEWHFNRLLYEPHSVVFPARLAQVISNGPPPKCEKNNGAGDVPATKKFTCPPGSHGPVEIEIGGRLLRQSGSHVVTRTDLRHNSGARGGFSIPRKSPYFLRFPVANATGFHYACGVHGRMMSGTVIVR